MKRILIVDDEEQIRNILRMYLVKEGYEVSEAEDGEKGLKLFYEKPFDLVILDVMLPKKDGWSILREIKKYKKISRILAGVVYILTLIFMEIDKLRELSAYTCSSLFWINMMLCLGVLKQLFSKGD